MQLAPRRRHFVSLLKIAIFLIAVGFVDDYFEFIRQHFLDKVQYRFYRDRISGIVNTKS